MMSFLDLSATSDEERRLISEILSDTSVVNFAQPSRQGEHQRNYKQKQQPHYLQQQTNKPRQQQHQYQNLHQLNQHTTKTKASHNLFHQQNNHQQHQSQQSNTISAITTNADNTNQRLNHVHNHHVPVTSENHHQSNHVHMQPSTMAGDINPSVLSIDMASAQHAGYPMAHPPSAHVTTAYGPPPPHHMYGGPPIFQPYPILVQYPSNLVYGNMSPYSVLPATNSVVTPRQQQQQQLPPQSNQPPSTTIMNNTHSRTHPHNPRQVKLKDTSIKHSHHGQFNKTNDFNTRNHEVDNTSVKDNETNDERSINDINQIENTHAVNYEVNETIVENQMQPEAKNITESSPNEENTIKISSDEGFDTQTSSRDLSKQSQDLQSTPAVDTSKSSSVEVECNSTLVDQSSIESSESNKLDGITKTQSSEEKSAQNGPWGSASSKSWASLFKGDGSAMPVSSNGDIDQINGDLNYEESGRIINKTLGNSEFNDSQNSLRNNTSREQRSRDMARRALDKMAPKLAQKINSINLKHALPLLRPRGFINKGDSDCIRRENSCTPILDSFAELFLKFPPLAHLPLDASKRNGKQVSSADQRMPMNYLQAEPLEPKCIYDVLGQIKSECLKGAQEDAEEFLSSVLNGLHEEMIGLSQTLQSVQNNNSNSQNGHQIDVEDINGDSNNDENLWREVGPKNRSLPIRTATVVNTPIQEIFGGSLFSIRTAGKDRCGHRSPFFDLQLDISGDNVKSLQDAIKSFTATEIIHDFYCSKTKKKLDAHRRTLLDQLPPILILHLKQFVYTQDHGLKKLMKRIEYPVDFELPDYCLHEKTDKRSSSRSYKLLAVVYHEGKEAVKGHYLTDVFHIGSCRWIRCDDSNMKVVTAPRIENPDSTRTPYLLFYRRLNTVKPSQSNSGNNHDNNKKKG